MVEDGFFRMLGFGRAIVGGRGISSASLPPNTPNPSFPSPMEGNGISSTFKIRISCNVNFGI